MPDLDPSRTAHQNACRHRDVDVDARLDDLEVKVDRLVMMLALAAESLRPTGPPAGP